MQPCVALSTAESEYYALCSGAQEGLLTQQLMKELGMEIGLVLKTDSSAARQASEKIGALRQKHMQLHWHFLKELAHNKVLVIEKVPTAANMSDMLTKAVPKEILRRCILQAESWRMTMEKFDEEHEEMEINLLMMWSDDKVLVRHGDKLVKEDNFWLMIMTMLTIIIGTIGYLYFKVKRYLARTNSPRTRTVATQSQTTYTALAHHATPRFTLVPDLLQGVFEEHGRRIWGQVSTIPRTSSS